MLKSPEEIPSGVFDLTSPIHPLINIHQHGCLIIVICHKLGAVDHVKLPVQIINMFLNGIFRDEEFFTNLLIADAGNDQLHDFLLPLRQAVPLHPAFVGFFIILF